MTRQRLTFAAVALLLIGAIAAVLCWLTRRSPGPVRESAVSAATAASGAGERRGGLPPPEIDLPPTRFYERVDGAEVALRALGCRRLMVWHLADVPADLEVLAFETEQGATSAFVRDVGADRMAGGPGDEAWTNGQALYLRRGSIVVRLIADEAGHGEVLVARAKQIDRALLTGELRP